MKTATWLIAGVVLCASCKQGGEVPPAEGAESAEAHRDDKPHEEMPRQLQVPAEIVKSSGITTEVVKRGPLAMTITLPGEVAPEPDRTARLSAAAAGRLEQVSFNEGSIVRKGDVLAVVRVPDVGRLRGALAATTERAKAARANARRLESLRESGLGSEQSVVDAEADARAQEAEARALAEQLGAIGVNAEHGGGYLVPLRAPISGVVVSRDAVVGQPIGAEHVLATVVDLSEVWFLGRVFEKDLGRLRVGAATEVQLNAFPAEHFDGVVEYVGQQTDPVARTLTARVRLRNEGARLRLGLFGTAHVEVGDPSAAPAQVVVPRSAVVEVGGQTIVFVRAKDGDFLVHDVKLGDSALGRVQVLSGLEDGEEVATHGVFTLKSLLLKSSIGEDD